MATLGDDFDDSDHPRRSGKVRYSDYADTKELLRDAQRETSRTNRYIGFTLAVLVALSLAMAWWTRSESGTTATQDEPAPVLEAETTGPDDAEQSQAAETGEETIEEAAEQETEDEGEDEDEGEGEQARGIVAVLPAPPTDGPYVDATLTDNVFILSGIVPSEEVKEALEGRAELAYAPFASSQLEVDESVGDAEWLADAPEVVGLLPMITDGTIRLQEDKVTLAGRSPNPEYAAGFEQAVGLLTRLPVSAEAIAITNLTPPRFVATVENGKVSLEGEIPSDQLIESFIMGASAVYGPENVTSTMTVDEGTYTSFWNYTMPGIFQLFAPFPVYRIQVADGVTSGSMQGGVLFDLNSAAITPQAADVLNVGVALLVRDRSLSMAVIGHTDNWGPDELNQQLSLARAESVTGYLVAAGIDPGRLTAEGRGSSEPIGSNETEEGRALNRRVEFRFD